MAAFGVPVSLATLCSLNPLLPAETLWISIPLLILGLSRQSLKGFAESLPQQG
jgi:hypothetical protein